MKKALILAGRLVVASWIPCVAMASASLLMAQSADPSVMSEPPGVHLSVGVISILAGIFAIVGPGFYLLGRYDHRLSTTEHSLLNVERRIETLVTRGIESGERVADSVESLASNGLQLACSSEGCPLAQHPSKRVK